MASCKGMHSCPAKTMYVNFVIRRYTRKFAIREQSVSSFVISSIGRAVELSKSEVSLSPKLDVYIGHNNEIPTKISVVADTGAHIPVAGPAHTKKIGIKKESLIPPPENIEHVGGRKLKILGYYPIYVTHNYKMVETLLYYAEGVKNMYILENICKKIRVIHEDFPNNNVDAPQVSATVQEATPSTDGQTQST